MTHHGPIENEHPSGDERLPAHRSDPVFAPFSDPQSYLNLLYLLLAFPLGLFYFVALITGLSVSLGLMVIWVGLPLLLGLLLLVHGFAAFERALARGLLGIEIAGPTAEPPSGGLFRRLGALLAAPETWLALVYLFLKFALGIASFTLLVSLFGSSLAMMAAPFFYEQEWVQFGIPGVWEVDSFGKAATVAMLGAILGVASFHLSNGLARAYGHIARGLLGEASETGAAITPH